MHLFIWFKFLVHFSNCLGAEVMGILISVKILTFWGGGGWFATYVGIIGIVAWKSAKDRHGAN